jgi:hypothetical protein
MRVFSLLSGLLTFRGWAFLGIWCGLFFSQGKLWYFMRVLLKGGI